MVTIRQNTFETNSSSTHCIVLCDHNQYNAWVIGDLMYCHSSDSLLTFEEYYNKFLAANIKFVENSEFDDFGLPVKEEAEIAISLDESIALQIWNEFKDIEYNYNHVNEEEYTIDETTPKNEVAALLFKKSLYVNGVMSYPCFLVEQDGENFEKTQAVNGQIIHVVGYIDSY